MKCGIPLIIYGENGVGKSRMADEIAKKCGWEAKWIIASNSIFMQRDLHDKLQVFIGREAVSEQLEISSIPILQEENVVVIFDNVVSLSLLEQIDGWKCRAKIVCTTTLEPSRRIAYSQSLHLKRLESGLVMEFFEKNNCRSVFKVMSRNTYLPLTLELAVAYNRVLGGDENANMEDFDKMEIENYVNKLYQLLESNKKTALELLKFCALVCGDSISLDVFKQLSQFNSKDTIEAVYSLERLALVKIKEQQVYVNFEVQKAVRKKMGTDEILLHIKHIYDQAVLVWENTDLEPWKLMACTEWRAHIETILELDELASTLCLRLQFGLLAGRYDYYSGEYISAKKLFQWIKNHTIENADDELCKEAMMGLARVMEAEKDNLGVRSEIAQIGEKWPQMAQKDPIYQVDILLIASEAEENLGYYVKAMALLKEGYDLLEKNSSLNRTMIDIKKTYILNGIGKICYVKRQYRKAMKYFNMALKCCDSTSGFREAQIKANKGYVWKQLKKYARAEEEFLGSLEIYESVGDVEPTCDELDALNGLVILYLKMKKYDQVERFWRIEQNRIAGGGQQHQREELYLYNCYGVYQYKRKCFDRALEVLSKGIVLCERYKNINYNLVYAHLLANRALVRIKKDKELRHWKI